MKIVYQKTCTFLALAVFFTMASFSFAETVKDQTGHSIIIPPHPKRVVSLAPSITEIIFALGQESSLAGATQFSNYPEKAGGLPKVGSYVHLDIEKIVSLNPDLCIAIKDGNPKYVVDRLESLGIPVFAVEPTGLASVMESIRRIAEVLNAEREGNDLVNKMTAKINSVISAVSKSGTRPRVFFQIGISPIVSVGEHTIIDELIKKAGGINLAAGPASYPRFSMEQAIDLKPDIVIITSMARGVAFEEVKKKWEQWPELPAVKNKRIFLVNSDILDRPTPRLVDGLETLARIIHPESFGNSN